MRNKNYISKKAQVKQNVTFESPIKLYGTARINQDSFIGRFSYIESRTTIFPKTTIGRYCSIGKDSQIGAISHPIEWLSTSPIQYNMAYHFPDYAEEFVGKKFSRPMETFLGNDVWIGSMVLIKRGVHIGNGAIVGGGAVVTKDVPPYAIVGGVPAKIIRYRFNKETIKKLLTIKWWDLPYEKLSGIAFDDIDKAIDQLNKVKASLSQVRLKRCWIWKDGEKSKLILENDLIHFLKKGWMKGKNNKKNKKSIKELQKSINKCMQKSKDSMPHMTFKKIKEIISFQLLEADIELEIIEDIMAKNKTMNTDYDQDEHLDQVILNNKIVAVIEIVLSDKEYIESKTISTQGYKKIKNILKDKL